jgi:hypothetical protein
MRIQTRRFSSPLVFLFTNSTQTGRGQPPALSTPWVFLSIQEKAFPPRILDTTDFFLFLSCYSTVLIVLEQHYDFIYSLI